MGTEHRWKGERENGMVQSNPTVTFTSNMQCYVISASVISHILFNWSSHNNNNVTSVVYDPS